MRWYIDSNTQKLVAGPNDPGAVGTQSNPVVLPRAKTPIELQWLVGESPSQAAQWLPDLTVITAGFKKVGRFEDENIIAAGTITRPGSTSGFYTGSIIGNSIEAQGALNTPDGNLTNDVDAVDLCGEITWQTPAMDEPARTQRIYVRLENIYTQGDEGAPTSATTALYPSVAYVTKAGNDTTARIGIPSKPFLTAQAAYDAAFAASGNQTIRFGVGNFGNIVLTADWPARIGIAGDGPGCILNFIIAGGANGINNATSGAAATDSFNVTLNSDNTVRVIAIYADGGAGSAAHPEGANGGSVIVKNCTVEAVTSRGGDASVLGAPAVAGAGGSVTLIYSKCGDVQAWEGASFDAAVAYSGSIAGFHSTIANQAYATNHTDGGGFYSDGSVSLTQCIYNDIRGTFDDVPINPANPTISSNTYTTALVSSY